MVIVSIYDLVEKKNESGVFCSEYGAGSLSVLRRETGGRGKSRRVWYKSSGDRNTLVIRRLHCEPCGKIHHELPDLVVPYKRYDAESLEGVVSEPGRTDVAADESTLRRTLTYSA